MQPIVPLTGASVKGPLGVTFAPRMWLKCVLAAGGLLPPEYVAHYAGANRMLVDGLGLDPDATFAYLKTQPTYPAFERWIGDHAPHFNAATVAATNDAFRQRNKTAAAAEEVRARIGLAEPIQHAGLLNDLDDWFSLYALVVAARNGGPPLEPLVPAISSQSSALSGLRHLPRLWVKASLNAVGALYPDWKSGTASGFDKFFCEQLGLDVHTVIDYVSAELPWVIAFEQWVLTHAAHASPAEIEAFNAAVAVRQKPEEIAVKERAVLGIADPNYRPSVEMNDLLDWFQLHQIATGTHPEPGRGALTKL